MGGECDVSRKKKTLKFWNFPDVFLKANMRKKKHPLFLGIFDFHLRSM